MAEIVDLQRVRAERSDNAYDWSVRDALQSVIDRIDRGEIAPERAYIAMTISDGDTFDRLTWVMAGLNMYEAAGLLLAHANNMTSAKD